MRVIFTRHGETNENAAGLTQGQGVDGSLNEVGRQQARRLAERLKDQEFQYIYTSDLTRAVATAQEVARFHPHARFITTPALRERNLGMYEGQPSAAWKKIMQESPVPWRAFKPEQGDSYDELHTRMKTFWGQLLSQHANDNLLIVSHGGALTMLFLHLFNRPLNGDEYKLFKPGNTAVTICEFDSAGRCTRHLLNSLEHLALEATV